MIDFNDLIGLIVPVGDSVHFALSNTERRAPFAYQEFLRLF